MTERWINKWLKSPKKVYGQKLRRRLSDKLNAKEPLSTIEKKQLERIRKNDHRRVEIAKARFLIRIGEWYVPGWEIAQGKNWEKKVLK